MPQKIDAVQERIFVAIDKLPEHLRPSTEDLCDWLDCSEQALSDTRHSRRILRPFALRRLARELRDAQPIVGEIVRAANQEIVPAFPAELGRDTMVALLDAHAMLADLTRAIREAEEPDGEDGERWGPAERREIQRRLTPLRRFLAEVDRLCDDVPPPPATTALHVAEGQ